MGRSRRHEQQDFAGAYEQEAEEKRKTRCLNSCHEHALSSADQGPSPEILVRSLQTTHRHKTEQPKQPEEIKHAHSAPLSDISRSLSSVLGEDNPSTSHLM